QGPVTFGANGVFTPPSTCGCEVVQAPQEYDYAAALTIASIATPFVPEQGGGIFAVTGTGFNLLSWYYTNVGPAGQATSTDFGLAAISSTEIDMVAPGAPPTHNPLAVLVSVLTGGGLSNAKPLNYA